MAMVTIVHPDGVEKRDIDPVTQKDFYQFHIDNGWTKAKKSKAESAGAEDADD